MNVGILGAGNIAGVMAKTINAMEDATLYAIGLTPIIMST